MTLTGCQEGAIAVRVYPRSPGWREHLQGATLTLKCCDRTEYELVIRDPAFGVVTALYSVDSSKPIWQHTTR
jgi:hypothetical protein